MKVSSRTLILVFCVGILISIHTFLWYRSSSDEHRYVSGVITAITTEGFVIRGVHGEDIQVRVGRDTLMVRGKESIVPAPTLGDRVLVEGSITGTQTIRADIVRVVRTLR